MPEYISNKEEVCKDTINQLCEYLSKTKDLVNVISDVKNKDCSQARSFIELGYSIGSLNEMTEKTQELIHKLDLIVCELMNRKSIPDKDVTFKERMVACNKRKDRFENRSISFDNETD